MRWLILSCLLSSTIIACPYGEFECSENFCIPSDFVCDDEPDCPNRKDEDGCDVPLRQCSVTEHPCGDGSCIAKMFVCDGKTDCSDGSDEKKCNKTVERCPGFRCVDGSQCVKNQNRCDSHRDCLDNSDEDFCFFATWLATFKTCQHGFKCKDGKCLSMGQKCDGRNDCSDGYDESSVFCSQQKYGCSKICDHICRIDEKGAYCDCNPGYRLEEESKCVVEEPCFAKSCSQTCTPAASMENTRCSCAEGFKVVGSSCKLNEGEEEPVIMFATGRDIRGLDRTAGEMTRIFRSVDPLAEIQSFDMDLVDGRVFAIVGGIGGRNRIFTSSHKAPPKEVLHQHTFGNAISDIVVDWVTTNIYFFDGNQLYVCNPDSGICGVVMRGLKMPRQVILDPRSGRMFWWSQEDNAIFQSLMDGSERRKVINLEKSVSVISLTYDGFADRIYWTDNGSSRIEVLSLKSKMRYHLKELPTSGQALSLDIFGDELYWTESEGRESALFVSNKFGSGNHTQLVKRHIFHDTLTIVRVFHPLKQQNSMNACWRSKCSHLCVLAGPKGFSCVCPQYTRLVDNTRCVPVGKSYFLATSNSIHYLSREAVQHRDLSVRGGLMQSNRFASMVVDTQGNVIYALQDTVYPKIIRLNLRTLISQTIMDHHVDHASEIHLDPVNRVLVWLETRQKTFYIYDIKSKQVSKIPVLLNDQTLTADTFTLDYVRGRIYFIGEDTDSMRSVIYSLAMDGQIKDRTDEFPKSRRLTVDVRHGTVYVFNADTSSIEQLDTKLKSVMTVVHNVQSVRQMRFFDEWLTWTAIRQRGFFTANVLGWEVEHIVRDNWVEETLSLAMSQSPGDVPEFKTKCNRTTCSHTCVSSVSFATCLCPIGMRVDGGKCSAQLPKTCDESEFACKNGYQCIPSRMRCDNIAQCDDESDEETEFCRACPIGMIKCSDSPGCYLPFQKCDGDRDCTDGSDEKDCPQPMSLCDANQFKCKGTATCLSIEKRCNSIADCFEADDELDCARCSGEGFRCGNGRCIRKMDLCDGWKDCTNGEDENNCDKEKCPANMHSCDDDVCLGSKFKCDGVQQCRDGSDERNCVNGTSEHLLTENCRTSGGVMWCEGKCLLPNQICDHFPDCLDLRDEETCPSSPEECSPEQFQCADKKRCIPLGLTCDQENDCGDNSDETLPQCIAEIAHVHATSVCSTDEFRCSDNSCIKQSKLCDHVSDCPDGSDEGKHCPEDQCARYPCQQDCRSHPDGYRCSCKEGYRLQSDKTSCRDIDECDEKTDDCSHYCHNTKGSYECTCGMGYKMLSDNKTCTPTGPHPILVFVENNQISVLSKRYHTIVQISDVHHSWISSVTFDAVTQAVFFSDESSIWQTMISESPPSKGSRSTQLMRGLIHPKELAYDWVNEKFYFVEAENRIMACRKDFGLCTRVPTPLLKGIRSLALAANEGRMFYSFWENDSEGSNGGIFVSEMDGSNPTLISNNVSLSPTHLTLDFIHRRVFFYDVKLRLLESIRFDGSERHVLLRYHPITSFTLYPDFFFWSEEDRLLMADWTKAFPIKPIRAKIHATMLNVIHPVRQLPEINQCLYNKCEQMCLIRPHEFACACGENFVLSSDNRTCVEANLANQEGLHGEVCEPQCHGSMICYSGRDRNYCGCPGGFTGQLCETPTSSSVFPTVIAVLLVLALIVSTIGVFVHFKKPIFSNRFTMLSRSTYRAQDMKKLVEDEIDGDGSPDRGDSRPTSFPDVDVASRVTTTSIPTFQSDGFDNLINVN